MVATVADFNHAGGPIAGPLMEKSSASSCSQPFFAEIYGVI